MIYTYITIKSSIIYVMIIKYIIYYVIALLANKSKKYRLIDLIAVVQGFMLSFEYFFKKTTAEDAYALINIILVVVIFYIITFAILYLFEITDKISNVFLNYKELEQDKQIKNSIFKITHEIKNPLAVLKGYLEMFNANDVEKSQKYINIMKNEVDRTLNIINDFMELSKIKIEKDMLDINLLIYETTDVIKLVFNKKDISLINEISNEEEVYIMGDYNRLKQVFINLFKNCYESIENKGIVKISAYIKNNYYIITIFDNGIGMSDETIKNIKHVFYTTKKYGSGVGVPLSNEIIKAHDGILSYESKLGEYTKTTIKLPILKEGN
ncbi:MAG: HAMP domain-containing histidine kinase [Tenericutes bacterium]|nr:HAMP domain-containing histidine kinase [Mycoplasmatota bacterium]